MRLSDYFDSTADRMPDRVALIEQDARLTFREAQLLVHAIAHALDRDPALAKGGHVAIYAPNHHYVPLLQLAINRSDHAWLSVHTRNPVDVNIAVLQFMDCEFMFFHSAYASLVPALKAGLPGIKKFICIDKDDEYGASLETWIDGRYEPYPAKFEDPMATAFVQPTGGTTGPSKAAVHTHRSLEMMYLGSRETSGPSEETRMLAVAPLTHAGGIGALSTLCKGGSVVVMNLVRPDDVLDAVEKWGITDVFLPPTLLYMVMAAQQQAPRNMASLKHLAVGAAPVALEKIKHATKLFGPVLHEGFGQTECGMPLIYKKPSDYIRPDGTFDDAVLASAGKPTALTRVEIMDETGRILPAGERGEIVVQAGTMMREYYKNPEDTAEFRRFGWGHTGDVGVKDAKGFITIVDRLKDMIVTGGFNVFPAQIEAIILEHDAVLECAVVGVPDEKWGEAVKAVVQLKPGRNVDADELIERVRTRLGGVYTPKTLEIWADLPRSAVGKLLRREVRAKYWADQWRRV